MMADGSSWVVVEVARSVGCWLSQHAGDNPGDE